MLSSHTCTMLSVTSSTPLYYIFPDIKITYMSFNLHMMSTSSSSNLRTAKFSILACNYDPFTSTVAISLFSQTSINSDIINASVDTLVNAISSFEYKSRCDLLSDTVLPFSLPHLFSFIRFIALNA